MPWNGGFPKGWPFGRVQEPSPCVPSGNYQTRPWATTRLKRYHHLMRTDVIVLGAGMVGISAALALQARGRSVVLVDRRGPAEETSYGNSGLIQREGIIPYAFPRDVAKILKYALNALPEANLHWRAIPGNGAVPLPVLAARHAGARGGDRAGGPAAGRALRSSSTRR